MQYFQIYRTTLIHTYRYLVRRKQHVKCNTNSYVDLNWSKKGFSIQLQTRQTNGNGIWIKRKRVISKVRKRIQTRKRIKTMRTNKREEELHKEVEPK